MKRLLWFARLMIDGGWPLRGPAYRQLGRRLRPREAWNCSWLLAYAPRETAEFLETGRLPEEDS